MPINQSQPTHDCPICHQPAPRHDLNEAYDLVICDACTRAWRLQPIIAQTDYIDAIRDAGITMPDGTQVFLATYATTLIDYGSAIDELYDHRARITGEAS